MGELIPVSTHGAPTYHFRGAMVVRVGRYSHQLPNLTMRFEMDGMKYTLQGLQEEDTQRTNNRLELVELGWDDTKRTSLSLDRARIATFGGQEGWSTTLILDRTRIAMFGIHGGWSPTLGRRPFGDVTLGVQGDWYPTLDMLTPKGASLGFQKGGDPMLC